MNSKQFEEVRNLSYKRALYMTSDYNISEDIANQTTSLFILKQKKIPKNEIRKWSIFTTNNFVKKFFTKQKKQNEQFKKNKEHIITKLYDDNSVTYDKKLRKAYKEALKSLTEEQKNTMILYYQVKENYDLMHEITNISKPALRKRISRIKKKINAETYLNLGYVISKKIVTPEMNDLIYHFLRSFKKNLENNTLKKMYYYFSSSNIKAFSHTIKIKEIIEYEIELTDKIYQLWVIYKDFKNVINSFTFKFTVVKNHLKIVSSIQKIPKMYSFSKDDIIAKKTHELLKLYPPDEKGKLTVPDEVINELLKDYL